MKTGGLKELGLRLYGKLGIRSDRTKNIVDHIGWSLVFQVGTILSNFLLVPLTINYLDTENYGVWLTLTSFIAWFSFFDIGLGNGLRNKFAEAKATGNYQSAQIYVSTAYITIAVISVVLVLLFLVLSQFLNWANIFNTSQTLREDLTLLLPIMFGFFGIQLVAKLIISIYQADQHHSIQNKIQFFGQALSLILIWILTKSGKSSLLLYGIIFSVLPVVILVGLNFTAFNNKFKLFRPKLSLWKADYLKDITGLGFRFFVVQIAALVLFSADNFIISSYFGPEEVVPYNLAFKYFSIVTMGYTIVIAPYWSSFTEAYSKNDFDWIKKSVSNIQKLWLFIPFVLLFMMLLSDWFYTFWVGEVVVVPKKLSWAMALSVLLMTFNMIYVNFINGVGKIQLQLVTSVISIVINIPLSIFLGKYLNMGTTGVILATCFCLGYSVILRPIQYYKLINNTAKGIWSK